MSIHGHCDERFESVREAFAANFEERGDVGASVCVTLEGDPVVDLWGGEAVKGGAPWEEDTIINVYSTTKTMASLCLLMLADRGEIAWDAPVARYWPGFEQNGKAGVLVRHVMSHSAGLSGFDPAIPVEALYDWEGIAAHVAAQAPWWEPGTRSGYHAVTQGVLQGEIVRQVTGRSIGTFFREEVALPLGADFHIGLDPQHDARVAELIPPGKALVTEESPSVGEFSVRTMSSCDMTGEEPKTPEWRRAEIPAAGGTSNARGVGRVHSLLACGGEVDGVRLLSQSGTDVIFEEQVSGKDEVLGVPLRFGMGFGLKSEMFPLGPNEKVCFWGGWGGSLAVIDADAKLTISYVMNRMEPDLVGDLRGGMLVFAAYQALAG